MKSVLLVFLAYLLFRQCIINHWCAYKQLWKSTTTKSSDWVYLNQKWFNICSINWVIFWRIENWVLLRDPNMNRLTLILFIQNPFFFSWWKMMWIRISVRKWFNWIHVAMQEILCSSSGWRWHHVFFYSIIIFLPLHFIFFKRNFIIWLNVILFKERTTKAPANVLQMQNDCYNVGWKGYPKWYAFNKCKWKRLGQRAIYRCACNSFFCLLSVTFCLYISTTCHFEIFLKTWKHRSSRSCDTHTAVLPFEPHLIAVRWLLSSFFLFHLAAK